MNIREEIGSDKQNIFDINANAFGGEAEASLVNALRDNADSYVSLVAEVNGQLAGHIMFTPVELSGVENNLKIMGLAPLAVLETFQKKGVGSELVKRGIEHCKSQGYDAIVVLGHPEYYSKFGFIPALTYSIKSEYDVSDDMFMVLELAKDSLKGISGVIKYDEQFGNL